MQNEEEVEWKSKRREGFGGRKYSPGFPAKSNGVLKNPWGRLQTGLTRITTLRFGPMGIVRGGGSSARNTRRSRSPENHVMPQKIIIDADPGIGDALAIALALLDPDFERSQLGFDLAHCAFCNSVCLRVVPCNPSSKHSIRRSGLVLEWPIQGSVCRRRRSNLKNLPRGNSGSDASMAPMAWATGCQR